jgi:hypothetical protein
VLRPGGLLFLCGLQPYRQLQGIRARFPAGQAQVLVEAHLHTAAERVDGTPARGFALVRLERQEGESGPEPAATGLPKLLSLVFRRRA